jgi:hypothetical protein
MPPSLIFQGFVSLFDFIFLLIRSFLVFRHEQPRVKLNRLGYTFPFTAASAIH